MTSCYKRLHLPSSRISHPQHHCQWKSIWDTSHIVPTDLKPDIAWWNSNSKSVCIAKLTVCFESNFVDAAERKTVKYAGWVQQVAENWYTPTFIPLPVSSRGVPHYQNFEALARFVHIMSSRDTRSLIARITKAALQGSFKI